jgi:hypothetical protein
MYGVTSPSPRPNNPNFRCPELELVGAEYELQREARQGTERVVVTQQLTRALARQPGPTVTKWAGRASLKA